MQLNLFSLLTFSFQLNNTLANQGDHCIVAASAGQTPRFHDNLVLDGDSDKCQEAFQGFVLSTVENLTRVGLLNPDTIGAII